MLLARTSVLLLAPLCLVLSLGCSSSSDSGDEFVFELTLQSMDEHVGELFELRAWNVATGAEVDRLRLSSIPAAQFLVTVEGLREDQTYHLDFYADFDGSGDYDAPPGDHSWRLTVGPVSGDDAQTFVHDTAFVDIAWP